jgi:long-chain acyl-CoA synthetase
MTPAAAEIVAKLPQRLHDLPARWARELPDAEALSEGEAVWTWRRLDAEIEAAAAGLRALGVRPGDRVMIVHENGLAAAALLFAASRCDAWSAMINARLTAGEIDSIREHCAPVRVVYTAGNSPDAAAHAARHGAAPFSWDGAGAVLASPALPAEPEPVTGDPAQDVAVLLYTTGTTGRSKGVMLSHRNLIYVAAGPGSPAPLTPQDYSYGALPLAHSYGLASTFLRAVFHGARIRLEPRFSAARMLAALREGITIMNGVPAMYARLLEHLDVAGGAIEAPKLRALTMGGAAVDPDLAARVERVFGMGVINGYGLTEAGPTVSRSAAGDAGSTGKPLLGLEVKTVDANGAALAVDQVGELWVRGPNIMRGYYRDPEATAAVLTADGWLKTGDLARIGPDGRIYIVDRAKEIIIRSGFNVSPVEAEEALNAHPEVVQAAVVGVAAGGNEEVVAFVERLPGSALTPMALAAWAAERLAPYKRPARIEIVEALPAAPTGKILKSALKRRAAALLAEREKA